MSDSVKNILFLLFIIAIGGLGYYLYTQEGFAILNLEENQQIAANLEQQNAQFIAKLRILERVDLQLDLFTDPRFTTLRSVTTEVPELEVGRDNPFRAVSQN